MSEMKTNTNEFNMIEILKNGLEREIRKVIINEIMQAEIDKFEKKLRSRLEPIIQGIALKKVESVKDMLGIRDELKIHIKFKEEK